MNILCLFLFLKALDFGGDAFGLFSIGLVLLTESPEHGGFDFKLLDDLGHVDLNI